MDRTKGAFEQFRFGADIPSSIPGMLSLLYSIGNITLPDGIPSLYAHVPVSRNQVVLG